MAKNSHGKRPCCICRKWFLPDVRQKGRQKTCSPDCKRELHRRQCQAWNKKNKAYFKNNYLARCFRCEKNFNTIDLVMKVRGYGFKGTVLFLKNLFETATNQDPVQSLAKLASGIGRPMS